MDIYTVSQAIDYLTAPGRKLEEIMVVAGNIEDCHELCMKTDVVAEVNIGGVPSGENKRLVHTQVYLSPSEVQLIKEMADKGIVIYAQDVPANKKVMAEEIISKY